MGGGCQSKTQIIEIQQKFHLNLIQHGSTFRKYYDKGLELGMGQNGKIYKCIHQQTQQIRVVKIYQKENFSKFEQQTGLLNEAYFLRETDHPNIIKSYEFFEDSNQQRVIVEYVEGTTLLDYAKPGSDLHENQIINIIHQLAMVLQYLKIKKIAHRNLNLKNILIEKSGLVKIIEFNQAIHIEKNVQIKQNLSVPQEYKAPEVIQQNYGIECDIWALGIIAYYLLCGEFPFDSNKIKDPSDFKKILKKQKIFEQKSWEKRSLLAKTIVMQMLEYDPYLRLSPKDILRHPWLNKYHKNSIILENTNKYWSNNQLTTGNNSYRSSKVISEKSDHHPQFNSIFDPNSNEIIQKHLTQLENTKILNILQQLALTYITYHCIPKFYFEEIKKTFIAIDKLQDGIITYDELMEFYKKYKVKDENILQVRELLMKIDAQGLGFITYTQFLTFTLDTKTQIEEEYLKMAFSQFDIQGQGHITKRDIAYLLNQQKNNNFNQTIWQHLLLQADFNKDGNIDYQDFCKLMKQTVS